MSSAPDQSAARLRLAIIGVGQIGSTLARQLAHAGHDVTVVARPGSTRLAQLCDDNSIVDRDGTRSPVRVLDRLDTQTPYDFVIVTLLAHQADAVLPDLARSAAACVLRTKRKLWYVADYAR